MVGRRFASLSDQDINKLNPFLYQAHFLTEAFDSAESDEEPLPNVVVELVHLRTLYKLSLGLGQIEMTL